MMDQEGARGGRRDEESERMKKLLKKLKMKKSLEDASLASLGLVHLENCFTFPNGEYEKFELAIRLFFQIHRCLSFLIFQRRETRCAFVCRGLHPKITDKLFLSTTKGGYCRTKISCSHLSHLYKRICPKIHEDASLAAGPCFVDSYRCKIFTLLIQHSRHA